MRQLERILISLAVADIPYMHVRTNNPHYARADACISISKKNGLIVSASGLLLIHSAWPTIDWEEEPWTTHGHAHHQLLALQP